MAKPGAQSNFLVGLFQVRYTKVMEKQLWGTAWLMDTCYYLADFYFNFHQPQIGMFLGDVIPGQLEDTGFLTPAVLF